MQEAQHSGGNLTRMARSPARSGLPEREMIRLRRLVRDGKQFFSLTDADIAASPSFDQGSAEAAVLGEYVDHDRAHALVRDFFDRSKGVAPRRCEIVLQLLRLCEKVQRDRDRRLWNGWGAWGNEVEHLRTLYAPPEPYEPVGAFVHPVTEWRFAQELATRLKTKNHLKRGAAIIDVQRSIVGLLRGHRERMAFDLENALRMYDAVETLPRVEFRILESAQARDL
jgi:hypothetical protein